MNLYATLLKRADPDELAQHSTLNHHVNGMHYLCLHRSDRLTFKIYFIERPSNPNSGFLVHPHSHRYAFDTTVLRGGLQHVRFTEYDGDRWDAFDYDSDSRRVTPAKPATCGLVQRIGVHDKGSSYWVAPHEIHSLRMPSNSGPIVLGLTQFEDEQKLTRIYLSPAVEGKIAFPNSRRPTPQEFDTLRDHVLELLA